MKKQIIILLFFAITQIVITQSNKIENVFSENILNEEFYKKPKYFPDIQNSNQFAVTLSKEGKYFIGTKESKVLMSSEAGLLLIPVHLMIINNGRTTTDRINHAYHGPVICIKDLK